MNEYEMLIAEAKALLAEAPGAQQVIVVRSAKGNIYHLANTCVETSADEDCYLDLLRDADDTAVAALVCMWKDGTLDVPSMHFRKGLLALNPANAAAELPLQSLHCLTVKRLEALV